MSTEAGERLREKSRLTGTRAWMRIFNGPDVFAAIIAIEAEAIAAERTRIKEAVRGLHDEACGCGADGSDPDCNANWYVNWPAAVLAIVNPEEADHD
jgi:hypothetical protein